MFATLLFLISNYYSGDNVIIISMLFSLIIVVLFKIFISMPLSNIWTFWAFSSVRNVHELKKRLILLGEISEKDTLFKRIENSTEYDRKYWKLHLKFAQDDIFIDDKTIPEETFIYYSKIICTLVIVSLIPLFAFGIFLIVMAVNAKYSMWGAVFGGVLSIIAVVVGYYFGYKKLMNREPQLILNSKGIYSNKKGFHKWEEIENCFIVSDTLRVDRAMLKYTHSRGHENINIENLNIKNNGIKLSKLLMVYQERNKLQSNRK